MTKQTSKQTAFTLVELLAVIVVIAVLAAALLGKYGQIRENGWSTQCKANLRSLYQAALNYTSDNGGYYPHAGPYETYDALSRTYSEHKGWVNWTGTGNWVPPNNNSSQASTMTQPTWNGKNASISITNGTLWEYTSHDMNAYFCPKFRYLAHQTYASSDSRYNVVRSYVMNSYFGCAANPLWDGINLTGLSQEASRTLMFADMQPQLNYLGNIPGNNQVCNYYAGHNDTSANSNQNGDDGVLMATNAPSGYPPVTMSAESIGFIHRMSNEYRGHAVFMDGHIAAVGLFYNDAGVAYGTPTNRTYDACMGQF